MIRLLHLICLLTLLPFASLAQAVQVTSGEHDGFTRLVLDYGQPLDWQVGRTTDGYELRLTGATQAYDLTGVYDLVGRGRLASVWVDPDSGALRIGIGCACHAQPFEFRPGIVVIDLKDGPPPKASAFEVALEGQAVPKLASRPIPRPRARPLQPDRSPKTSATVAGYDWKRMALDPAPEPKSDAKATSDTLPQVAALPGTDPSLQPLRDALLQQLSRGAAQGVVDMAQLEPADAEMPQADPVRVRMNDMPGIRIDDNAAGASGLTAQGASCVADDQLDLGSWGTDRPVSEQMAEAMIGLMGEFDTPDPEAQLRAVRFLLFIGFGAEAQQILAQLSSQQADAGILTSLAHVVDASVDAAPAFAGMAACDTAAALWAILSDPNLLPGAAFDRAAMLRSFSTLPVHLRRHVGPTLVDRLLMLNDPDAATAVRNAIMRAPGDAGPEVALMEARLDLDAGNPENAAARLEPLITSSGPATSDAQIAQVATHLAQRTPLAPEQVLALEGLLHERRNSPEAARVAVAVTQARALAGDFDRAFADLEKVPDAASDVWSLLAEIGPDSALLTHAIQSEAALPVVPATVAAMLAKRLSDLGFASQAGEWLRQVPAADTELAARIALQSNDARTALRLVAGTDDPALAELQSKALYQLADEAALADMLARQGDEEARWRAVGRARDWQKLAASGPTPWQPLASTATGAARQNNDALGALAQGKALVETSAQTRQQVADLLATVTGPTAAGF